MKMNSLRKTNLGSGRHFRPSPKRLFVVAGALVCLVIIGNLFPGTPFKNTLTFLARPFWYLRGYVVDTSASALTNVRSKTDLIKENAGLNQKLQSQEADIVLNRALQSENDELKAAFGRVNHRRFLLATVLSAPAISAYDTIVIDAGADFAIKPKMLVFFSSTTIAGYVSEVYPTSSLVRLYSSPNEEVTVYTESKHFFTKAIGQGGGNFMVNLPHDSGVKGGDLVMFPGTPAALLGKVGILETDIAKSLQIAHILSPFNASEAHFVYVQKE